MEDTFAVALTDSWVSDSYRLQSWLREVLYIMWVVTEISIYNKNIFSSYKIMNIFKVVFK